VMTRRLTTAAAPPKHAEPKPKPTLLDWLRQRQTHALS